MNAGPEFPQIAVFEFEGETLPVRFKQRDAVTDGVTCDSYIVVGDESRDLGIIYIEPGKRTPLQRVLEGIRTVESYIRGKGRLVIIPQNGEPVRYEVGQEKSAQRLSVDVQIGESMQWQADPGSGLVASEVCYPPYEEGRYENIQEAP